MILYDPEPLEVCILKKQLAHLSCKCSVCENHALGSYREESKGSNKEIQTNPLLNSLDQTFRIGNTFSSNVDFLSKQISCPGCYIAINLLKAREMKICKDEVSETKSEFSYCDKSSGKCVRFMERSTSMSSIINTTETSYVSLCEKITNTTAFTGIIKKRSNEHVTFSDYLDKDIPKQEIQAFYGDCFCLQSFMDSISPPMPNS